MQFIFPLLMLVMLVMMIMGQRRQARQQQERLNSLAVGDEVVTIGGLHGVIDELNETTVVLDCDGIYLTYERAAIRQTIAKATNEEVAVEEVVEDKAIEAGE